ncbi:MAG: hypothetical protein KJ600_04440 [Nanoarchaeota archaeon]|nr:hypothetical protein [Nanoarchaeota archaeon]MBU1103777.1 hypothetical protein [Nanoarchaeota archaeon]
MAQEARDIEDIETQVNSLDELHRAVKKVVRIDGYGLSAGGTLAQYRGSEEGDFSFAFPRTRDSIYLFIVSENGLRFGKNGIVTTLGGRYITLDQSDVRYKELFDDMVEVNLRRRE